MDIATNQSPLVRKISIGYLLIVLVQGCHSIEEYFGQLWNVLPPATVLCSLFSNDLRTGFLIINIGLFLLGLLFWFFLVRHNHPFSNGIVWFWIVIELINGVGHPTWTIIERAYTPGLMTAPFLLLLAIYLLQLKTKKK